MFKKWKLVLDKGRNIVAIFMNLSKASDTLNHKLHLAKLYPYGFSENDIIYIKSCLYNRYQRTNLNNKFCNSKNICNGVLQRSVLGPNIFINDMFHFIDSCCLCNYVDNNRLHVFDYNMNLVKEKLYRRDTRHVVL